MKSQLAFRLTAIASLFVSIIAIGTAADAQFPAFPGADGAGAQATGGRGGVVYHVTRLDTSFSDNGPGTLHYGLSDSNFGGTPRTIVFDVGGTIWLGRNPTDTEGWDTQDPMSMGSNITLAGQTAPGGITIMGGGLKVNGGNAIIRNVSIAPGYGTRNLNSTTGYADSYVYDAMNIHAPTVMVDHVSGVFATDETVSMDEFANNVTVQYSNISQGQNYPQADAENPGVYTGHALGSLIQPGSNAKISVIHNLYAHLKGRLPRVGTEASKLTTAGVGSFNDFRNNVFYNWLGTAGSGASGQPSANNFVGNFYLAGPGGDDNSGTTIVNANGGTGIFSGSSGPTGVFQSGNLKDTNKDGDANDGVALTNSDFGASSFQGSAYTQVPYLGVTESATTAYNRVLNYAGANWSHRDSIDARIINEVRTGTGKIMAFNDPTHGTEWNALLALRSTTNGGTGGTGPNLTRAANYDTDNDGMPNAWEQAHGLNSNGFDNNGDFDADGYTNLEEYLNDSSAWPAPQPLIFNSAGGRFELTANWNSAGNLTDMRWQPSRYDEAQINAGICTLNSPGQHASVLKIAANAGNIGELDITSGWLKAETSVIIGNTATSQGKLVLSGGELSTALLSKNGPNSTFNFTGGKLHATTVGFDLLNQGGTIAPGDPFGGFDANGNYLLGSAIGDSHVVGKLTMQSGSIEIELASAASFDTIHADGLFTAAGTLKVLLAGYTPALGDSFHIFTWGSETGNFSSLQLPAISAPLTWDTSALYSNGTISVVPEPSSATLAAILLVMALVRIKSKA